MSRIISISNQKGGVSKTVSTFNLGASLSLKFGKKVLLADIDPQANLSDYLGYDPDEKPTITHLIAAACQSNRISPDVVRTAIRHSDFANVDYIPSDINLAASEKQLSSVLSRETVLKRILSDEITQEYDFILIDCLPSLSTLLINALTASDEVLIPVQTQKFSLDGLTALECLYEQIKTAVNPKLNLLGILPTMVDRTKVSRCAIEKLSENYADKLMNTRIRKSIDAAKSCENRKPLCLTSSKLGEDYIALAMEVLENE